MFGSLLSTRVKAAENALRQGRLDEAYRIASAPDVREHRRGPALLEQLTEKLIERAREYFAADRFAEALRDLDWAGISGTLSERISALREQIKTVADAVAQQQRVRTDRIADARRRIAEGSLEAGRRILDAASEGDAAAAQMKRDIAMRDHEASKILVEVEQLVRDGQWVAAAERFAKAKALDPHDPAGLKLEADLCAHVLKAARDALADGKIVRAADEFACLGRLGQSLPAKRELEDLLRVVKQAGEALRQGDYDAARQGAMRLQHLAPEIAWAPQVVEQLRVVDEMLTSLRAGPLGAFASAPAARGAIPSVGAPRMPASLAATVALGPGRAASALPERLLLLVDGGGSYLLLRKDRISIGKAATSNPADIAMFSDLSDRHADIARVEEDYFLYSPHEVEVGGRLTRHQLLRDGDRVVLGPKAKCTFRLPSRKSPTAVIDLSDTSKLAHDVRRVVLFDQHATLGCGPGFHIPCQMARNPLVLFERGGGLWIRPAGAGRATAEAVPLEIGQTIEIDGVTMTTKAWSQRT
jgi:hypothetical protein